MSRLWKLLTFSPLMSVVRFVDAEQREWLRAGVFSLVVTAILVPLLAYGMLGQAGLIVVGIFSLPWSIFAIILVALFIGERSNKIARSMGFTNEWAGVMVGVIFSIAVGTFINLFLLYLRIAKSRRFEEGQSNLEVDRDRP